MAIQTVGIVMAIAFMVALLALLFSWINARVKAYYSPQPYYLRRPKARRATSGTGSVTLMLLIMIMYLPVTLLLTTHLIT